jgi:hypothetical protein
MNHTSDPNMRKIHPKVGMRIARMSSPPSEGSAASAGHPGGFAPALRTESPPGVRSADGELALLWCHAIAPSIHHYKPALPVYLAASSPRPQPSPKGGQMFTSHATPDQIESIRILVVFLAVVAVIFWRAALRIILILLVILLLSGAVAFIEGFLHGIK